MKLKKILSVIGVVGLVSLFNTNAAYAKYPEKPVKIIVGYAAGGTTDLLARLIAKELNESLDTSFVVENKPGASSNIAINLTRKAKPDGYTLLMTSISLPINQTIYKNVEFDAKKDFDPIVLAGKLPNIIATNKKSDFKTFEDFDEFAKKHPDEIRLGAPGPGSSLHLAYEFYKYRSNTEMIYVPYNGSGPTLNALMGNDIDVVVDNISAVGPHIKNGNIKGLAVTSNVRSKAYPDIPTMEELGYEDFDINSWFGLIAPHGMKKEDRELLNKTIHEAFQKQENIDYLNNLGIIYEKNSTDEFGKFIADETDRWSKVIKEANITID